MKVECTPAVEGRSRSALAWRWRLQWSAWRGRSSPEKTGTRCFHGSQRRGRRGRGHRSTRRRWRERRAAPGRTETAEDGRCLRTEDTNHNHAACLWCSTWTQWDIVPIMWLWASLMSLRTLTEQRWAKQPTILSSTCCSSFWGQQNQTTHQVSGSGVYVAEDQTTGSEHTEDLHDFTFINMLMCDRVLTSSTNQRARLTAETQGSVQAHRGPRGAWALPFTPPIKMCPFVCVFDE